MSESVAAESVSKEEKDAASPSKEDVTKDEKSLLVEALGHLAAGKRNMLVSDVSGAVSSFADCCTIMGEIYGETAPECGEPFYYYGKALLEMARLENGVLENRVGDDESSEENSAEEEEEDGGGKEDNSDEKKEGKEEEKDSKKEEAEKSPEAEKEGEEAEEEEEKSGENESIASNDAGPSDTKETEDKSQIEAEDEDDPSSLQLAWEMLELAKQCLQKKADAMSADDPKRMEIEARLNETFMQLGEVSIESENYPQAIEDLTSCLRRRQELLPEDSRCIAETHYQIGVARGFNLEFEKAVGSLEDAIVCLEKRIANLKEAKESKDPEKKEDAFYTREKEIEEIQGLVPEIREKIADTIDMERETHKKLGDRVFAEEKEMEAITEANSPVKKTSNGVGKSSSSQNNGNSSNGKSSVSDISHMVKKRKKSEENNGDTSEVAKKTKSEEKANRDSAPAVV